MSALNSVIILRKYLDENLGVTAEDAVISLIRIDADFASSDHNAALALHALVPSDCSCADPLVGLRGMISFLTEYHRPLWTRQMVLGRRRVFSQLNGDEKQVFRSAGLYGDPPSDDVVDWWDQICLKLRLVRESELLAQGRRAERLSLASETRRLRELGIQNNPVWVSIDDNTAGYDIRSQNVDRELPPARLIEVKSSTANPPVIIVSRNEWDHACRYGAAFIFHFWDLTGKNELIYEKTVEEVRPHIPVDSGSGRWRNAEIPLKLFR
ncbi:MAG TPA: DUF3883 domain-containing protein [Rhizomicrobium sp.]|nr:DUF3883 domain-containing protein [Rhizomicrobium sp.]